MDYLDSFGEWMRQRREALRLTRPDLADCVGCSVSALRKIEADERRPSQQLAELLAGCLLILPEQQPLFLDAARGARPVARLGRPAPRLIPQPLPSPPVPSGASSSDLAPHPAWNLPAPATLLIGREAELEMLTHLLADPDCRLLTLVGPGGIGKTRLAIETACYAWERFADGVFLASLAATSSPDFMVPAIAQAAGLNFAGPAEPRQQLVNYLSNKQLLLLLDNLEHLLDGLDLVVEILERAPGVKLLATSRERLELQGEWVFEVQGLPVPAEDEVEGLEKYSSIQLFLQRAHQARIDFDLSRDNRAHVSRICRLVEGMPLAIELAAAWVPVLSCGEIADQIEDGLEILTTQLRDAPERQRSLQAVFDHSWKLLAEEEKRALRQLSVFRGGFQREAAEEVAGASLPLLSALVAKSFLRRTDVGRCSLHELVRQYLEARLAEEPEEEVAVQDRHSAYFADLVARLEGDLKGARQAEALAEMDVDIDNIRRAWRWAVRRGQVAVARKPIRALWYYYDTRGWFQEAEASFGWAADKLEASVITRGKSESTVDVLPAYARAQQGWFCLRVGRFEDAQKLLDSNLEVLRAAAAYAELVDALQHAGTLDRLMGDYGRSQARFQEMMQYALRTDDLWSATIAKGNIGLAAQAQGDYEEARERIAATITSFRALGDKRMLAVALHFLGGTSCALKSYDQAQAHLLESLALSRSIGDRWIESMTLCELGSVAQAMGEDAEAASMFHESLLLARQIGEHWSILQALNGLGPIMLALGDLDEARATFSEELAMAWEMQALPHVLAALGGLARWSVQQQSDEAVVQETLMSMFFILNHPAATQKTKDHARQLRLELETRLQSAQVAAAQAGAQNLSLEALVASVLGAGPRTQLRADEGQTS